ncbi:MAG: family 16 glycoside hydrolase [Thermoplasmatota archaeon]
MARTVAWLLLFLTSVGFAGCTTPGDGGPSTTTSTATDADVCPGVGETTAVAGWTAHGGQWGEVDSMEGHDGVVCGEAGDALQSLVRTAGIFSNLEANVSFNMLAGDSGAGLVIHFADDENFNIVRYSPREQGWHLFTMVGGNRQKQDDASVTPPTTNPELHEWVKLRIVSTDGHIEAYHGNIKVIEYRLPPEASHEGRVGYFLRDAGMAAAFDDFTVRAL